MTTPFALLFFRPAAWAAASEDVQKNFRTVSFLRVILYSYYYIANRIERGSTSLRLWQHWHVCSTCCCCFLPGFANVPNISDFKYLHNKIICTIVLHTTNLLVVFQMYSLRIKNHGLFPNMTSSDLRAFSERISILSLLPLLRHLQPSQPVHQLP